MRAVIFLTLLLLGSVAGVAGVARGETLRLLGRGSFPHKMVVGKTKLGGLSGISYNAASKTFWAISDDSAYHGGPPRAYQLALQLDQPDLQPAVTSVLILRDEKGRPFPVADCEGIATTGSGGIWVSSEGKAGKNGALPWVKLFSMTTGKTLRTLPLPEVFLPSNAAGARVPIGDSSQTAGIVTNHSLESCTLAAGGKTIYTANETSLVQEKAPGEGGNGGAGIFNPTQVRIAAFNPATGACLGEKLYLSDAGCLFGSISDVCALPKSGELLVLERRVIALKEGPGSCGIRIYKVNFNQADATDLQKLGSVKGQNVGRLTKTLVYDSREQNIDDLDNVEGLALVPLANNRTGLLAVSDDNFNDQQQTQFLLFELVK